MLLKNMYFIEEKTNQFIIKKIIEEKNEIRTRKKTHFKLNCISTYMLIHILLGLGEMGWVIFGL